MASITLAASSNAVVSTGWTNPTNAYGTAADGTLATASPAKNGTVSSDYGFASFSLPAGAVVSSVVINVGWKLSVTTLATLGVQGRNNGVADSAAEVTDTTDTTTTTKTFTFGTLPSVADLNTAGRVVARVRDSRGNTNTAHTGSLDFVSMTVTYTVTDAIVPASISASSAITAGALRFLRAIGGALINATSYVGHIPLVPSTSLVPAMNLVPDLGSVTVTAVAGAGGTKSVTPATINATSSMTASVRNLVPVTPATINATSVVTATLNKIGAVKATISATSALTATLSNRVPIAPVTVNATSSVTVALNVGMFVIPSGVTATSTITASLAAIRRVAATAAATSAVTASLSRILSLGSATINATSAVTSVGPTVDHFLQPAGFSTSTLSDAVFGTNTMNPAPIADPVLIPAGTGGVLDPSTSLLPGTGLTPGNTGAAMSAASTSTGSMVPA